MIVIALLEAIRDSVLKYQTRKQLADCDDATLIDLGISPQEQHVEQKKANGMRVLLEIYRKIVREMRD